MNKLLKSFAFRSSSPIIAPIDFIFYRDIFIVEIKEPKAIDKIMHIPEIKRLIDLRYGNLYLLEINSKRQFARKLVKMLAENNIKTVSAYLNIIYLKQALS